LPGQVCIAGSNLYFPPYFQTSLVVQFNTGTNFSESSNWISFDLGPITGQKGWLDCTFDPISNYVYFAPTDSSGNYQYQHGVVVRYNTMGAFQSNLSWNVFDASHITSAFQTTGFSGISFDGFRYIYFTPYYSWIALRYDTAAAFNANSSYQAFNFYGVQGQQPQYPGAYGAPLLLNSFLYYSTDQGYAARYDLNGTGFTNSASWATAVVNPIWGYGISGQTLGRSTTDGRFIYFASRSCSAVLRYDTTNGA